MGKIKIGVFGAGRGRTMINEMLNNPDAEVVVICDKFETGCVIINTDSIRGSALYADYHRNHTLCRRGTGTVGIPGVQSHVYNHRRGVQ